MVYSGFIGSEKQINIIVDIIEKVKNKNNKALIVIDPVMGDYGCTYATYNNEMITKMSQLVKSRYYNTEFDRSMYIAWKKILRRQNNSSSSKGIPKGFMQSGT